MREEEPKVKSPTTGPTPEDPTNTTTKLRHYLLLGLWGGVFVGRKLAVDPQPNSDDIAARLEF